MEAQGTSAALWRKLKDEGIVEVQACGQTKTIYWSPLTSAQAREVIPYAGWPGDTDQLCMICAKWCAGLGFNKRYHTDVHGFATCDLCCERVFSQEALDDAAKTLLFADGKMVDFDNGDWGMRANN